MKYCIDCKFNFFAPSLPRYRRCGKAPGAPESDAALCGSMRRASDDCGPDAKLFEAAQEKASANG